MMERLLYYATATAGAVADAQAPIAVTFFVRARHGLVIYVGMREVRIWFVGEDE